MMLTMTSRYEQPNVTNETAETGEPDVVILHDSLFKAVKPDGLMRREKQRVLMKWAPKLDNALEIVLAMKEKPKVVLLHVGTNDLNTSSESAMIDAVKKIQEVLEARSIKLVYSFILPTATKSATGDAEVMNSRIARVMGEIEDVFIGGNDRFYSFGLKNENLFEDDGIHFNGEGTKALVLQTKDVLCRALGIENNFHSRSADNNNDNHGSFNNRRSRYGNGYRYRNNRNNR